MHRRGWQLVVLTACILAPTGAHAQTVAVLGDDSEAPRTELRRLGFDVLTESDLSPRLSSRTPVRGGEGLDAVHLHLENVESAFHSGRLPEALAALEHAESQLADLPAAGFDERVEVALWTAGVAQSQGDQVRAATATRLALTINPNLVVDLNRFWPSLADAVEAERASITSARLALEGLPPDAEVFIDGGRRAPSTDVSVGSHTLYVRAPGFEPLARPLEVQGDARVPVQLYSELDRALERFRPADGPPLCASLRVDICVISANQTLYVFRLDDGAYNGVSTRKTGGAQNEWLRAQVGAKPSARKRLPSTLWVEAGLMPIGAQGADIEWGDSKVRLSTDTTGLSGGLSWRPRPDESSLFFSSRVSAQRLLAGKVTATGITSDLPSRAPAGWFASADLLSGYHSKFGGRFTASPFFHVGMRSHRFADVQGDMGRLGLFGTTTFALMGFGLGLSAELGSGVRLGFDGMLDSFGAVLESGDGFGNVDGAGLGGGGAELSWRVSPAWELVARGEFSESTVELTGDGDARVSPMPQDAEMIISAGEFSLALRRGL